MKTLLVLFIDGFATLKLEIDPTSFRFYGSTEGYNYNDHKSFNNISFVLSDINTTDKVIEEIKSKFELNPKHCNVDNYVSKRDKFEDYVKDKRPRISIKFSSGYKGTTDPPSFEITNWC